VEKRRRPQWASDSWPFNVCGRRNEGKLFFGKMNASQLQGQLDPQNIDNVLGQTAVEIGAATGCPVLRSLSN